MTAKPRVVSNRDDEQRILDRVEHLIKTAPAESPSHVYTITPWVAQQLLERYNAGDYPGKDGKWHNRSAKPAKIAEFADDMTDDHWKLTGDTIKFSDKQRLRDGQNRLFSSVKSGKNFRTHVVFGIDDEAFPWMDRGKPRSGADALHILGIENANTVAGAVRWLELLRTNRVKERDSFTPAQTVELLKNYDRDKLRVAINLARKVYQSDRTPVSLGAALAYDFGERAEGLRDRFFDSWATGTTPPPLTPIRLAVVALKKLKEDSQGRINDVVRSALWVIAWNSVVTRRKRGAREDFKWRTSMDFPEIRG
jgi:hypothetical protein